VPIAVREGGVDQIEPEFDRAPQGAERLVVIAAEPLFPADSPRAVSDLADFEVGPAELAVSHRY